MVQHHIMARCPGETVQSVTVQCGHEDSLSTPTGRGSTCPKTMRTFKCFWSRWKPEAKRKPWRVIPASSTRTGPLQCRAPACDPVAGVGGGDVTLFPLYSSHSHVVLEAPRELFPQETSPSGHMTSFPCMSLSLSGVDGSRGRKTPTSQGSGTLGCVKLLAGSLCMPDSPHPFSPHLILSTWLLSAPPPPWPGSERVGSGQ